jgi:hypothetical protein
LAVSSTATCSRSNMHVLFMSQLYVKLARAALHYCSQQYEISSKPSSDGF